MSLNWKHWRVDLVEHDKLPVFNLKHQTVLLDVMRSKAVEAFAQERAKQAKLGSEQDSDAVFA